jgi:hypothetical protein
MKCPACGGKAAPNGERSREEEARLEIGWREFGKRKSVIRDQ